VTLEQIESGIEAHVWAQSARKFFLSCLYFFGSTCTFSRFGEHFRGGQYSLASFLFSPR